MATVTLPKYVVFKGHNGKYLRSIWAEKHQYHQFSVVDNIGDEHVRFEVVPVREEEGHGKGHVRIKSLYFSNRYWRRSPNWIWSDTLPENLDTSNKDLLFHPVQVDSNTVALRCLGNNMFCRSLSADNKTYCLNASASTLEKYALMRVEEPLLRRRVHSVVYDLKKAKVYDEQVLVLATNTATNNTAHAATVELCFSSSEKKSCNWSNSVSFTTGVCATFTMGVPEVVSSRITVSSETNSTTEWGKTVETDKSVGGNYHVVVDPYTTVTVNLQATKAKCDVPFSYVQEDLLTTGDTVVRSNNDGLYKGGNYTNMRYVASYA